MNAGQGHCALLDTVRIAGIAGIAMILAAATSPGHAARQASPPSEATPVPAAREVSTPSGLKYLDQKIGTGPEAATGRTVEVLYTGWLENGVQIDASKDPNHPLTFRIGIDDVIQGWHEGITGMRAGGKRRLVVPPELGYGRLGAGEIIPPNATLVFEVELLNVR